MTQKPPESYLPQPDTDRCQVIEYNSFPMGREEGRCICKSNWIVTEIKPGSDGNKGSQSVCDSCKLRWQKRTDNLKIKDNWEWRKL